MSSVQSILANHYGTRLAGAIVSAYSEIERNFVLRKWKPSEIDAGHFVEGVRRALEFDFSGKYTPIGKSLPPFDDKALKYYENQKGDDSLRMLIPRSLKSIYNVRNKRGAAHISNISPNEMDSSLILYSAKWVLAELLRLNSGLSHEQTQQMMDEIIERKIPLVWKSGSIETILNTTMSAREQVLVYLFDSSPRTIRDLQILTEYSHTTNFKKIIQRLHVQKYIVLNNSSDCHLTPSGSTEAELLVRKYSA